MSGRAAAARRPRFSNASRVAAASRSSSSVHVSATASAHGPIAVTETCTEDELQLAAATREAFENLGRRAATARPDTIVLVTPHNVHVQGAMAVVIAGALEGAVAGTDGRTIGLEGGHRSRELADLLLEALHDAVVPTVGVSYGGNRADEAAMPMDWGTLIPLGTSAGVPLLRRPSSSSAPPATSRRTLTSTPAVRSQPPSPWSDRRVVFVASVDHGHRHDADGPYGYHPASAEYDGAVAAIVGENRLKELLALEPAFVEHAAADSWWQLLMLHGALGDGWQAQLLSYEAPTYYGVTRPA